MNSCASSDPDHRQTRCLPLVATFIVLHIGSVQSTPSPQSPHHRLTSGARAPPRLPQYYSTSSQRPPSPPPPPSLPVTSSLAPTSPVYTAQRIRPSNSYDSGDYSDDPYPASAHLGTARTVSGSGSADLGQEETPGNSGFVEAIDFGSLLKDIGSSPKGVGLDIAGASGSQASPLFASESKDTFQGFFKDTKNPFEELSRLNTASSDSNSRQHGGEGENVGFVDPNVQFRSLFESAGSTAGFGPADFLGSKSENVDSDPSKGSQTKAYPSYTYSGRAPERGDSDYYRDDRGSAGNPNRYRSSYRQVGEDNGGGRDNNNEHYDYPQNNNEPDYYPSPDGRGEGPQQYDAYQRISHNSPSTDSYDDNDGRSGSNGYYNDEPAYRGGGSGNGGGGEYERATPRYAVAQETSHAPQAKPTAASPKNSKYKKIEKQVDYASEDHASFTEPDDDYDPSTYQGRYKRQARQRSRQSGGSPKRPMTCYVCEDENGRYAEKCSYDSSASPNNKGNYYHSESSSYRDNGRRPGSG